MGTGTPPRAHLGRASTTRRENHKTLTRAYECIFNYATEHQLVGVRSPPRRQPRKLLELLNEASSMTHTSVRRIRRMSAMAPFQWPWVASVTYWKRPSRWYSAAVPSLIALLPCTCAPQPQPRRLLHHGLRRRRHRRRPQLQLGESNGRQALANAIGPLRETSQGEGLVTKSASTRRGIPRRLCRVSPH